MRLSKADRLMLIERASKQVGPSVFWSTVIVIASFLPVFLLTGQEGKLFSPLAWTKTFILIVDAVVAVTLTPVLISYFLRGRFRPERRNPVNRGLDWLYGPVLRWCLEWRKTTIGINLVALAVAVPMLFSLGSEFMPPLNEGSILFMPVTLPDVSNGEIKRILQVQDKIIRSVPEVASVLGKAGRANTATDNAPLSMIETIIMLKPQKEWRRGLTKADIVKELDQKLQIPGVVNGWTQPIINRINMLATGIRTDVGVKVYGQNLDSIYAVSTQVREALSSVAGVEDLYVEPITGGKYLEVDIDREALGRYGLTVDDVNMTVESALGGMPIGTTIEGRRRFSIAVRLAEDYRNSLARIERIPIQTPNAGTIPLSSVARLHFTEGPPMIQSENAQLRGAVLFNVRDRDLGSTVQEAIDKINAGLQLPQGYYLEWSGQWENQVRANRTLTWIIPLVLVIILAILFFTFRSLKEALLNLVTIPFALVGGVYIVYFWGVNLSVAVAVGFIALFGLAIETAMVMVVYLNEAMRDLVAEKGNSSMTITKADIREYVFRGAAKRLRPKIMTVSVALFGLVPVLWATGVGTDVMQPIVLPMIGGVFTSSIHILLVTPVVFEMTKEWELKKKGKLEIYDVKH
ncbi:Cu(I)/Ag(I) efflux system membrane protein CusA/SilA [Catalinimonas alkaloidigena]|uniref:Cu(I)/Ag(I) efflux system membrane protein CusA/SilA n=1 Tax=Catalinimonas alkaloidigena TaxID=1075417 RepID=A0A1G9AAK4_9BACT|nr:efflux RND transporter permease subunit [Catalinimonas alkaloidigena]SDK24301.1 Cu(I)/Ag(I) efflux system membrane protein CusA/SilA [Catalinimonas alkaloidigena]